MMRGICKQDMNRLKMGNGGKGFTKIQTFNLGEPLMASRPSLVTPSGRLRCSVAANFPRWRYQGYRTRRTPNSASRCQRRQKLSCRIGSRLTWTCTHKQITLLPTSTEGLSIPPALPFAKDQTQAGNNNDSDGKETKAIKSGGKSNGGNMDRGPMMFTSDVSLPKDDKQLCWVNKLQLGNWQNYKRTAMLIMRKKARGSKVWAVRQNK